MFRMGNSCAMQRQKRDSSRNQMEESALPCGATRSSLRQSVVCEVPDRSIARLYPIEDNYVNTDQGSQRNPKSLASLCVDTICRSLPDLDGSLPAKLPQEVVDDIVQSLHHHNAWNTTTIRALRNCELKSLEFSKCRGVTDAWLEPFGSSTERTSDTWPDPFVQPHNYEATPSDIFYGAFDEMEGSSCSASSFLSAASDHPMDEQVDSPVIASPMEDDHNPTNPQNQWKEVSPSVTENLVLLDVRNAQRLTDRGLMQLSCLDFLQVAKLDGCHSLTGRGLLALSGSVHLHTLSMADCRRITDEGVLNISHLASLRSLCLDGCRCLTDRSLAALSDLTGLRRLDMSQCDLITDDGLQYLESLTALEELSLGWCRLITDEGLKLLVDQPYRGIHLLVLRLARCSVSNVECLERLSNLRELDLNGCSNVKSRVLANVLENLSHLQELDVSFIPGVLRFNWQGKIRSLQSLQLCYSNVKDVHIMQLLNQSALEELNLDSCPVGDAAMGHLADRNVVPNLRRLDLADTNVTDRGLAKIAKLTTLTHLSLFYCNITNRGLRHVAKLSHLRVLNLDSRDISDDGLYHLQNLHLNSLDIFSGHITDAGCVHIAKIQSLESLELCGGGVGDFGCSLLALLENLTSLNLSQNERISNRGAAALAALANLKVLNLSSTRVNSHALKYFGGLHKLESLALYGCGGADSCMVGKLQGDLPNLKCLRLGACCDEDGMYVESSTDDDEDDAMWGPIDGMDATGD